MYLKTLVFLYKLTFSVSTIFYSFSFYIYTSVEIYFYKYSLHVHGRKNISNFFVNINALEDLITYIDGSIVFYEKRLRVLNYTLDNTFSNWLQKSAKLCTDELKFKKT